MTDSRSMMSATLAPIAAGVRHLARAALAGLLLAAMALPASAAMGVEERLREIAAFAEHDNAAARTRLVQEGPALIAGAPYTVRMQYLRLLRRTHADAGSLAELEAVNEQMIALAETEGDQVNLALASLGRIQSLVLKNDPSAALSQLELLCARYKDLGNPEFEAGAEAMYGSTYNALGQYDRALRHLLRALDVVKLHPGMWTPREPEIRLAMANMYLHLRDPARALETLGEIRAGGERLSLRTDASVYVFQGRALVAQGDTDAALAAFDQALELTRAHELTVVEGIVLGEIANAYLKARRYDKAETAARAALALTAKAENATGRQVATANLGFALYGQGRELEGLHYIDTVIDAMRKAGAMSTLAQMLVEKSQALEQRGDFRGALAAARERESVARELALDDRNKAISALQEQHKARERVAQIETLRQENAVKDAEIRQRGMIQTVASLGAGIALFLCAGVLWLYQKSVRTGNRLVELNNELAYRSAHDPLTGLFNRRSFLDRMRNRTGEAAARPEAADCFTLLDIDHFKRINDEYGHATGDAVLVEIGRRLRATMREKDMVLRWGGEEFLVYSQGVAPAQQPHLVRRILEAIAATPVRLGDGSELAVSCTAGAVSLPLAGEVAQERDAQMDWEQAIALADRALYKGKETGRNRGYIVAGMRRPEGALQLDLILPGVPA